MLKRTWPGRGPALLAALLLGLGAWFAFASLSRGAGCDETWNGSSSTDWNTAANWTPASVPTGTQNACIPAGSFTVALSGSDTVESLTVGAGDTVAVTATQTGGAALVLNANSTNSGTLELTDSATSASNQEARVVIEGGATLTNDGTILSDPGPDAQGTRAIDGQSATSVLDNASAGTITVNQDLQIDTGQDGLFTTSGNITIASGEKLLADPAGGGVGGNPPKNSAEMDIDGGTITDNGTFAQGLTEAGSPGGSAALKVNGGTITGAGLTVVNGADTDIAGSGVGASFSGTGSGTYTFIGSESANTTTLGGTIGPKQTVVLSASTTDGGVPVQVNSNITNNGTLELTDSDTSGTNQNAARILIGTGDTLTNNGTILASGAHGQRVIDGQSATSTVNNAAGGTISVNGNLQLDTTQSGTFTTGGTINVAAGQTLQAVPNGGGGTFNLNSGSVTNDGTLEIGINSGGNSAAGATFNINGGTVTGNPIIAAVATTNFSGSGSGAFTLEGATSIFGGGTITGTIDKNDNVTLSGTTGPAGSAAVSTSGNVVNDGTMTLTDPDTNPSASAFAEIEIPSSSTFTNDGTLTIAPGPTGSGYRSIDGTLNNTGTLKVNMLLQLALHAQSAIDTSGTVDIAAGQGVIINGSSVVAGDYNQSAGTTTLGGSGATLTATAVNLTGGTLTGSGTLCGPGGTQAAPCGSNSTTTEVTNGGTFSPSPSPATLTVDGDYTQGSGGTLTAEVTGPAENDQLSVSGTATLDGTLAVSTASGFNPGPLSFTVLTAQTLAGQFATTTGLSSGPYNVSYTATGVELTGTNTAPEVSFNPGSLAFGSASNTIAAGATVTQTLTVNDTGNAPLQIGTLSLSGPQASSFSLSADGCSGQTVQAGNSCSVTVGFHPAAAGNYSAQVNVPDNASGSPQAAELTGVAGAAGARIAISPAALSFGLLHVGVTAASQTVKVTSTGSDPLTISSTSLTGSDASDFHVTSDTCAGQTIVPGGSCTTAVAFTPSAAGTRTASLAYADDAPGSPHTVALTGDGTDADLAGTVTAAGQPVAGAGLYACPSFHPETSSCVSTTTANDGTYGLTLAPGAWLIQVTSPSGNLFGATATVDVGNTLTIKNFTLSAPTPLGGGFGIDGQTSGVPTVYYNAPYSLKVPLPIPGTGKPNSTQLFFGSAGLDGGAESSSPSQQFVQASMIILPVHYGATGAIDGIDNPIVAPLPCQASAQETAACASLYQLSAGATGGSGSLRARDRGPVAKAAQSPVVGIPGVDCSFGGEPSNPPTNVTITPNGYGGFSITTTWADGSQSVFLIGAAQIPQLSGDPNQWGNIYVVDPINALLNLNPLSGWYNAAVGSINSLATASQLAQSDPANAARYYASAAWQIAAQGIGGKFHGAASFFWNWWSTEVNGVMTPSSPANPTPTTTATPTGYCKAKVANAWIDPSGAVRTTSGVPVAGATVTLLRSRTKTGRLRAVPRGSGVMSPGNRRNPDHTNALGLFGWDVLPGFYQITASHQGCSAAGHRKAPARSRLLPVPPAQTGITLTLRCPTLHRRGAHVHLTVVAAKSKTATYGLVATVTGGGPRPQGDVTFSVSGRVVGEAPLVHGVARLPVPGSDRASSIVRASYVGDGYHAPASTHRKL